jgi:hypothetical protein
MFNVCVNCVAREWLQQVLGEDVAQDEVEVTMCNQCMAFIMDNRLVAARCPEWLQLSFSILIILFK